MTRHATLAATSLYDLTTRPLSPVILTMPNTSLATAAALAMFLIATTVHGQQPANKTAPPLRSVMQLKLEYSKQILEGLALEDYDKITKNSQALSLLSLESGWNILQTEEYVTQSREFRRTADLITDASRDKNLERAALGYVALTVRCIECHGYLRKKHPNLRSVAPTGETRRQNSDNKK